MPQLADRSVHQVVGHAGLLEFSDESTRDVDLVQDLLQVLLVPCRGENRAPSAVSRRAMPNPIPEEAPVTIAVRPASAALTG